MNEGEYVQLTCNNKFKLKINEPPNRIIFGNSGKEMIEFSEKGIVFNHAGFPDFKPDDFVREFIDIMEKNFKIKFLDKIDPERGYLRDNVTIEQLDHPSDSP